jgi:putative oxidoreductase
MSRRRGIKLSISAGPLGRRHKEGETIMKIALVIVRSLMGLLFLFSSITFLFRLITPPEPTDTMKTFSDGLAASVYLMPTVKITELICGIAFLSGRFVPIAEVLISPIIVNIIFVHVFLGPEGLPVAIFLVLANSFVAYNHRESYKTIIKM